MPVKPAEKEKLALSRKLENSLERETRTVVALTRRSSEMEKRVEDRLRLVALL